MTDRNEARELIAEARRLEGDYGDSYEVMCHMSNLADALEAALNLQATAVPMEISEDMVDIIQERLYNDLRDGDRPHIHAALEAALSAAPVEGDRLSMEVIEEYRRIVIWLEAKAAVLAPSGDTMHGLAAEALGRLIEREYLAHTIPMYAMLDIWQALYGTSHPEFDEFYAEHGYAETWARLCAAARSPLPVEGEVEWGGKIVTASFEDGQEREPYCGLEDCECPDHEGSPLPAGTYITVRLDEDHPVGLRRVTVREVAR